MKSNFRALLFALPLCMVGHAKAALVSLDFTNAGIQAGSSTTYSSTGDVWRATNVRIGGGPAMDAIFTITGATGVTKPNLTYSLNPARGNNMRVIMSGVVNATVTIRIDLVNAGTNLAYTGFTTGDTLITQFSDLDSDAGSNRSDFAGARTSQFNEARTSNNVTPGSSNLDLIANPAYAPDYTVGILKTPWTPQDNVTLTTPAAQSPVTAAFLFDQRTSIDIVLGQRSVGSTATRHIDIDMTPDFIIVPEPSTALLGCLGMLFLLRRRR